jgi:hypothetical protein
MNINNNTSVDMGTIRIWVGGVPENLLQRPMLSQQLNAFLVRIEE